MRIKIAIAASAALFLGACGGGGGGGGGGGSVHLTSPTRGITVSSTSLNSGVITPMYISDGTAELTGNQSQQTIATSWNSGAKSGLTWQYQGPSSNGIYNLQSTDHTGSLLFTSAHANAYSVTALAETYDANLDGAVRVFYIGAPENQSRTDTVAYDGISLGRRYNEDGTYNLYAANAHITANFGTGDVDGLMSNVEDDQGAAMSSFGFNNAEMTAGHATYDSNGSGTTTFSYGGAPVLNGYVAGMFANGGAETSGVYMIDAGGVGPRVMGGYTAVD